MPQKIKLLFVDDDRFMRQSFAEMISNYDYQIKTAGDGVEALEHLDDYPADIVITDLFMPNMDGIVLLREIQARHPNIHVIVVTGSYNAEEAVKAMKAGAYDYILKPFVFNSIIPVIEGLVHNGRPIPRRCGDKNGMGNSDVSDIVGQDPQMRALMERIDGLENTNATVLITGETGAGKNLIARTIHDRSLRKSGPFVRVECAALTENIGSGELFGHEKWACTRATSAKAGFLEAAGAGSLFLDEVGELALPVQAALLQSIETRTFHRVGGTKTIKANARIICSASRYLSRQVEEKQFREDLFSRINIVALKIPPLRERISDIPLLAAYFLEKFNQTAKKNISGISHGAMEILTRYAWPGNVRELSAVIENAAIFCRGRKILPADIQEIRKESSHKTIRLTLSSWSLIHAEETLIRGVLHETNGNLKMAAETLGIARGTLYSKMKRYGIEKF